MPRFAAQHILLLGDFNAHVVISDVSSDPAPGARLHYGTRDANGVWLVEACSDLNLHFLSGHSPCSPCPLAVPIAGALARWSITSFSEHAPCLGTTRPHTLQGTDMLTIRTDHSLVTIVAALSPPSHRPVHRVHYPLAPE